MHCSMRYVIDKANEIINNIIKPGMSDFEKEIAIYDYISKKYKI